MGQPLRCLISGFVNFLHSHAHAQPEFSDAAGILARRHVEISVRIAEGRISGGRYTATEERVGCVATDEPHA